jgi:hypothetical protein
MAIPYPVPTTDEVRVVLAAAADVLFSDGVPGEFLDQWADETHFLLEAGATVGSDAVRRPT